MNNTLLLTLLFIITILIGTNAQWYIIKKNYPSHLMNYPNPGKRSISEDDINLLDIDCSVPYAYLNSREEKTAWLGSCNDQQSPLISLSTSSSIEDELYFRPQLISHEKRTLRSSPPYLSDRENLFNRILLKRLQPFIKK